MPVVPRATRQVETAPLPGVRLSPLNPVTPPLDLGGAQQVVGQATAFMERQRQHADQLAVLEADNKLSKVATDLSTAALQKRGKDALGVTHAALNDYTRATSEIGQSLTSDRQREAFTRRAEQHWSQLYEGLETHAAREARAFDEQETTSGIANSVDNAIKNPMKADAFVGEAVAKLRDFATRNGIGAEAVAAKEGDIRTKAHAGVIENLLNADNYRAANAYYTAHRDDIQGEARGQIEHALELETLRGESQRHAERIMRTATTLTEAKSMIRELDDPKLRDETEQRVRREFADREAERHQQQAQAFDEASAILERTGDFHAIPMRLRTKLSPEENGALQRREDQMRHPKRETDMALYTTLMTMAGLNDETRQDFAQANLAQFRNQLDEDDFKSLVRLQLETRNAIARGDKKLEDEGEDVPDRTLPPDIRLQVPQAWADSAATNPAYLKYLRHLRAVPGAPAATRPSGTNGPPGNLTFGDTTVRP